MATPSPFRMRLVAILAALILAALAALTTTCEAAIAPSDPFVKVDGIDFKLGKDKYVFQGFNAYQMLEAAADWGPVGRLMVKDIFKQAKENGLTVMRTFAFAGRLKQNALMTGPGEYNDKMLEALDFVMDEASKQDIRVVLVLDSYWNTAFDKDETHANGIHKYLQWIKEAKNVTLEPNDFYTNAETRKMYKDHVKFMLNRKNTVNGRVYKNDPAILSYNIMNEPRCEECGKDLQKWIDEMAAYVRSIDKNHMITVGEDGFYSSEFSDAKHLSQNPGDWAHTQGKPTPCLLLLPFTPTDTPSPLISLQSQESWWAQLPWAPRSSTTRTDGCSGSLLASPCSFKLFACRSGPCSTPWPRSRTSWSSWWPAGSSAGAEPLCIPFTSSSRRRSGKTSAQK